MTNALAACRSFLGKQSCAEIHLRGPTTIEAAQVRGIKAARSPRTPKALRAKSSRTHSHIRHSFVTCRAVASRHAVALCEGRSAKADSAFVLRHCLRTAAFDRNRFPGIIDRDERKDAVRDAQFFTRHVARHPHLDRDGH